MTIINQFVKL